MYNSMNKNTITWTVKPFETLSTNDLYRIVQARVEIFVIEQNTPYQDLDNTDQKALHLWAEQDGKILAYCRLFNKGIKYNEASIGRVLTTEGARGTGLGKQLIARAIEVIEKEYQTSEIRISAQDYLIKFYSDFGFQDTGKKYLEDNLPHTEMIRR